MLTCKEFLQELSEYLDDTVDADFKQKLQKHVSECPNCWVVFDTTKKTLQVYKGMEPQEIPDEIRGRLMNALRRKMEAGRQD